MTAGPAGAFDPMLVTRLSGTVTLDVLGPNVGSVLVVLAPRFTATSLARFVPVAATATVMRTLYVPAALCAVPVPVRLSHPLAGGVGEPEPLGGVEPLDDEPLPEDEVLVVGGVGVVGTPPEPLAPLLEVPPVEGLGRPYVAVTHMPVPELYQ
jgi:hypothetical protein